MNEPMDLAAEETAKKGSLVEMPRRPKVGALGSPLTSRIEHVTIFIVPK